VGAVPLLIHALQGDDEDVRRNAARALGDIGEGAVEETVPALIQALQDVDGVRYDAATALSDIGEGAVPALIQVLQSDDDRDDSIGAALALGQIGEGAVEAVPALIQALKGDDDWVRRNAAEALEKIRTPEAVVDELPF